MNLRDLEYLVAVADHLHFGRAAAACHVSQPTLSTQVRKLEAELGVALVERNPRQIMLTEVGRQIVDRARSVLAEVDDIGRIAQQSRDPSAGTIRLGLFPTLGPYLLPHVVPELHRRFPRLQLLLVEEKTNEIVRQLRDGRLDLGVLALPIDDDQLHAERVFDEDFVLAVPADHPLADGNGSVPLRTISDEPILLLEDGHCLREQALAVCSLAGVRERTDFRATSLETLRQMVASGVGITLLPQLSVQAPVPRSPDVQILDIAAPVPHRSIALLWRPTHAADSLFRSIADVVRQAAEGLVGVRPL